MGCGLASDASGLAGNHFTRSVTRGKIYIEYLEDGRRGSPGSELQHSLYCTWNAYKWNIAGEEGGNSDLVGGVEGDAGTATGCSSFVGETEARETGEVRSREVQLTQRAEVKS
jgi:hypothetical protein